MENHRNFSGNTLGNNATVNQGNFAQITVNTNTSNADKSFLQEISKTDPFYDKKRILALKGPLLQESFSWILRHQQFNEWRHAKESGVLWIKGDPGKGKTMLLCGIIEDLEQNPQSENLSYFFCQATDYRINTGTAVVGGLIKSLLKRHPRLLSRVRENYEDKLKDQLDGANALFILCDIFETITNDRGLTDVICVVDALDECIKDCRHLLNLIIKTSGHVKWLLSSRNEKDIEKMLDQVPQKLILELKQNAERISTSIDAYIRHHIHEIEALKDDKQLQAKALDILKGKAQGTFLWVALVVEQLHKTDHWDVGNVLEVVPKDLESLYGLILDRTEKLGERGKEICRVLLSIVTTAKRPLHLQELLVFINSHWKDSRHFKTTYALRDVRDMVKTCGSILSIRDDTVYFIHQSAKDHVVENAAERIFPILHQHYKMFEASLDAMSNVLEYDIYGLEDPAIHIDDIPLKDVDSDPLASIRYCCVFWVEHLVSGYQFEGFEHSKYLKDDKRLHSFFKEKFLCWIESLSLMRNFYPQAQDALQKLKDLIESYRGSGSIGSVTSQTPQLQRESETQGLKQFTDDGYGFVRDFKEPVAYWPLQLYFSAINFEQDSSTIRKTFEQTVHEKFGPSPTLASVRHGQSSLRLQGSFRVDEGPSRINTSHFLKSMVSYRDPSLSFSPGSSLVFSPDSSLIGQMSVNKSTSVLRFWRADSGALECTFPISPKSKFVFSPIPDEFISVSQDGIIKRWSMDIKSCIREQSLGFEDASYYYDPDFGLFYQDTLKSPGEEVIALSPNGDLVASWYRKRTYVPGLVKIWNTETTCCDSSFESDEAPHLHAAFSPNSQLLALSFIDGVRVHNAKTSAKIKHLISPVEKAETVDQEHIRFAPNSKVLVVLVSPWHLCLWDTHTWKVLHKIKFPNRFPSLECLAISPDSEMLATSSSNETMLWSIDTGECVVKIPVDSAYHISFAPNWTMSYLLALQQHSSVIQTWSVNISQTMGQLQHADYVFDNVTVSVDSKFVASRHGLRREIYVWSGDNGQLVHVLKGDFSGTPRLFEPLIFSPDSELLAHSGRSGIHIWSLATGELVRLLEGHDGGVFLSPAFSDDPKHLVASNFNEIYIWHIDSGQLIHKFELHMESKAQMGNVITSISPKSAHVSAFWDSERLQARIWHLHTGKTVMIRPTQETWTFHARQTPFPSLLGKMKISFSSDSAILVSITESMVQIFGVTTGACLQRFALEGDEHLRLLSFDPTNGRILTTKSVFYKTSSWEQWQTSPRLGYSYDHRVDDPLVNCGIWILLDGKKSCYVPSNFRPGLIDWPIKTTNIAMTDSLLAILNELTDVVIIKFPTRREVRQQVTGTFDVALTPRGIAGNVDDSYSVARTPATSNFDLSNAKRKRRESDEPDVGSQAKTLGGRRSFWSVI